MSSVKLSPYYKRTDFRSRFAQQVSSSLSEGFVQFGSKEMEKLREEFKALLQAPSAIPGFVGSSATSFETMPADTLVGRSDIAARAELHYFESECKKEAQKFLKETETPPEPFIDEFLGFEGAEEAFRAYLLQFIAVPNNIEISMHCTNGLYHYEFVRAGDIRMVKAGRVYAFIIDSEILSFKSVSYHGPLMQSYEKACRETRLDIMHKGLTPNTKKTFVLAAMGLAYNALAEHFLLECMKKIDMDYADAIDAEYRPDKELGFDLEEDKEFYCYCCAPPFASEEDELAWEKRREARSAYIEAREFDLPYKYKDEIYTALERKTKVLKEYKNRKNQN
jgi:hypothetical protein